MESVRESSELPDTLSLDSFNSSRSTGDSFSFGETPNESKYRPTHSNSDVQNMEIDDRKSAMHFPTPPSHLTQKRKSFAQLFPWLSDVTKTNQKCLGSIIELKDVDVLKAMDFLIK